MRRALLLCVWASATSARLSFSQCPDGTPPPCRGARVAAAPAPNSVAVLYFENGSRDSNDVILADGITEEIINRLSGIERLSVRSRYLVRRYRGTALQDPATVGRALNVTFLVSGTVRRAGGRLRVSAELIRAAGGVQVWGQQFDQSGEDVFAIQEAVAREVATGIVGRLLPAERQTIAARPTTSTAAYAAYLRGNFFMARRDSAGMRRAIDEFETALRADPDFTDALSRIALAYGITSGNGLGIGVPPDTIVARAARTAAEAVRRAPNSSDAWTALAIARLAQGPRSLQSPREAFERAIALDPSNAEAHHLLGFVLEIAGEDSLGMAHDRMALAIEPARPVTIMHLAQTDAKAGRYGEARRWVDSALTLDSEFWTARAMLAWLKLQAGDTAGARAEVAHWDQIQTLRYLAPLAQRLVAPHGADSASLAGWRAAVRATIPADMPVSTGLGTSMLAMVAARDPDIVLDIQEAARPRGAFLHYFMTWTIFDPLRNNPRFQRLWQETTP